LPAKLILAHEDKVSPTLWEYALKWAMWAWLVWFVLILVMMTTMYWIKKWLIAIFSLTVFLTILFAIVKLIWYSLSLSWLAAILLNIWMWVDANVLIFERMKEELKSWKTLRTSIVEWVSRSWLAIRDWNLTIAFIWLLLVAIWTNMFKGFGFMMLINIALTFFVIVPLTKDLLLYFYENQDKTNLKK